MFSHSSNRLSIIWMFQKHVPMPFLTVLFVLSYFNGVITLNKIQWSKSDGLFQIHPIPIVTYSFYNSTQCKAYDSCLWWKRVTFTPFLTSALYDQQHVHRWHINHKVSVCGFQKSWTTGTWCTGERGHGLSAQLVLWLFFQNSYG